MKGPTYTQVCSFITAAVDVTPDEGNKTWILEADAYARKQGYSEIERLQYVTERLAHGICFDWFKEEKWEKLT